MSTTTDPPSLYRSLAAAVDSWRVGSGAVPTTRAGAEIAVMITIVGWRLGTLAQLVPAIGRGVEDSPRPALYLVIVVAVIAESAGLCWFAITTRGFSSPRWATVDVAFAAVALLLQPLYVASEDLIGTWSAWAPGLAINAAVVAALGLRRRREVAVATVLLAGCYFAVSWSAADTGTQMATVRSNTLSYPVFAAMARAMGGFVRRFGAAADDARTEAIEAARVAELERHRRMLHDQAGLLRLLSDPTVDPRLAEPLRQQALAESNRLRTYLDVPLRPSTADGGGKLLVDVVANTAVEFNDLPVNLMLDLGRQIRLSEPLVEPVRAAVATLLANVRIHATGVTSVVLHTDTSEAGDQWELTIRDDGCGFDPATTPPGFGLGTVVTTGLRAIGVDATVDSAPGRGTVAVLNGPL
ncbi:MAG: ATP-binding protein [Aeromicrobium sp.]